MERRINRDLSETTRFQICDNLAVEITEPFQKPKYVEVKASRSVIRMDMAALANLIECAAKALPSA